MPQIGGVYIDDSLMPTAAPGSTARPTLGAILGAASQQAYGQVRYGLPMAVEKATGNLTDADAQFYAKGLQDSGAAAATAAPASAGDVLAGRVGVGRFLAENLVAGAPMLAAGAAGGIAGGLLGGPAGALAGTIATTAPQLVGSNVERAIQAQGGLSSEAAERSLIAAPVQAAPEALLGRFVPGAGHILGDFAAEQSGGFLARTAKSMVQAGITGAAATAAQEAGARYAGDQNMTDADAVSSYVNAAATGFAIGGVIGAGGGIKRTAAHDLPAAQVTPDDLNTAIDNALNGTKALPGPDAQLALPAPGQGAPVAPGNDVRRPDFQVDPRGNVAPATPEGAAALAATPVGDAAVDSQGNAIVAPTADALMRRANLPVDSAIPPSVVDAFTARFGAQDAPGLDLPGGRAQEVQPGLPFASPAESVETPASRLPQLGLDPNLSDVPPETQLSLGERRTDDVSDPNVRAFQGDSLNRLKQALADKQASPEVKAAATAEIAQRTAEATGQAPLTGDFQQRLAEVKDGLRSQWVDKLTADNPQELVGKVYDELFENQNTQANVTKLGQRLGLLDDKLEPTELAQQVEAQKAAVEAAQAAEPEAAQGTPVGTAPVEPEASSTAPSATTDAAPAAQQPAAASLPPAPQTVDPAYAEKWNQLKSQAGIDRVRGAAVLRDTPPNEQAAEATVFRALADDSSNAQVSQVEKMARQMGLVTDNDSMDVTPKGRQAYLSTPEGREDITGAAREQGYDGTSAATFDRGVQAQLGGAEVTSHTSFEDMAAYQAGKVWAQDFIDTPGTKTLDQTRSIQTRQDARANGRPVAREEVQRSELTPGQVRQQALNRLLDAADLRGAKDEDVARLRRMVRDGGTPEEVGGALAQVQGGKTLFREPERTTHELPDLPTRGQPVFKEMNTPDRVSGTKAGTRAESEDAVRTFRLREVIKQALLDGEIKTARAEKLNDLLDRGEVDQVGRVVTNFDANSIGAYMREGDYRPTGEADLDRVLGTPGKIMDGPLRYPPQEFGPLDQRSMNRDAPAKGLHTGNGMNDRELAQYRKARWLEKQTGDAAAFAQDKLDDNRRTSGASDLAFEQAIQGKSFHEAADYMVDHAPSPYLAAVMKGVQGLASKLENLGQRFEMNVVRPGDRAPVAVLGRDTRALAMHTVEPPVSSVWLKSAELGPAAGTNFQVAAHEMIHSVTMRALNFGLRNDQANTNLGRAARDLISLGNAVVQHFNQRVRDSRVLGTELTPIERDMLNGVNALRDHNEVLAWGMTNPDFQRYLQGIQYAPRQSVFSRLVEGVRKMLGIDGKYDTALTELMRVSEQINGLSERDLAPAFGRDNVALGETGPVVAHLSEQGENAANRTVDAANDVTKRVAETVGQVAEKVNLQDMAGKARRAALGWVSQNHLDREYGSALPAMLDRSEAKRQHDAVRGRVVSMGDQAIQRFQALEQSSKPLSEKLGRLMALTTEFRLDPDKGFDAHLHLQGETNVGDLQRLHGEAVKMKNDLSRGDGAGYKLYQEFRAFNEMQNYAHFATDLHSLVALDPELTLGGAGGENPMDAFMTRDGLGTSGEARDYWRDALDAGLKSAQAFVNAKRGETAGGTPSEQRAMAQHLSPIEAKIASIREGLVGMARAPYFHLGRFGDYFGSATIRKLESGAVDPKAQAHVAQALADAGFDHVQISTDNQRPKFSARFDSVDATKRFESLMLDLHKQGWLDGDVADIKSGPRELNSNTGVQSALPSHVAAILSAIETNPAYVPDEGATPQVKAALEARKQEALQIVRDAYLEQQPDSSISKVLTARYTVPGYDPDMVRNFAHRASVGATALANKATTPKLGNAWRDMRSQLAESRSSGSPHDQYLLSDLIGELQQRDALNPIRSTAGSFDKLRSVAHSYYLGMSPAYGLVQLAQIGSNALPELAKKNGYTASFHALRRASVMAFDLMRSATAEAAKGGWKHYADVSLTEDALQGSKLSTSQKDFMRRMISGGSIDIGQSANALQQIARHGSSSKLETALKYASAIALHSETFSRLVTALAAHELHGGDDVAAKAAYAHDVVSNSMFDFQSWNRARQLGRQGFAGPITPLLTQFMTFSTQMTEKLYSEIASAVGKTRAGETPEQTAQRASEARTYLLGHMTAIAGLAGTLGLPFASVFASAINKMVNATRSNNDEQFDATASWRNFLADVLGKDVGEVVARGAPRALGFDVSTRLGESDLLPFSKVLGDKRSWREAIEASMGRATGAAPDMLINLSDAGTAFGNGDVVGGMKSMMPVAFKGPIEAYRMSEQGYVDSKGRVLPMEPGARDILYQLIGLTPADKAEYQEARGQQADRRVELTARAGALRTQIVKAITAGDTDRAHELVTSAQEFDKDHPAYAIIPSLSGAVERQQQARAQARALGTPLGVPMQDIAGRGLTAYANFR